MLCNIPSKEDYLLEQEEEERDRRGIFNYKETYFYVNEFSNRKSKKRSRVKTNFGRTKTTSQNRERITETEGTRRRNGRRRGKKKKTSSG